MTRKKNKLYCFKNPICFQGSIRKPNYFEGWYYKCVTADRKYCCAFIPGISTGASKYKRHAFIQFADSTGTMPIYRPYSIHAFTYSDKPFCIHIGTSTFSETGLKVRMRTKGNNVTGELDFGPLTDIRRTPMMPTIMGYYRYIPFMECFHNIISLHHNLDGKIQVNGHIVDFTGGVGYLEKDFGTSFPKQWVWIHSNTFRDGVTSLMCSIASIPFIHKTFQGFLCILYIDNKEYRFATYLRGKVTKLSCSKNRIFVEIQQQDLTLQIRTMCENGNVLIAPKNGDMNREIIESMAAQVKVSLISNHTLLYESISDNGCMEYNT